MSRPRLDAEQKKVSFSLAFSPNLIAALEKVRGAKSQSVFVEEWLRQNPQIAAELAAMNDPGFVPPIVYYEQLMERLLAFYWPGDGRLSGLVRILFIAQKVVIRYPERQDQEIEEQIGADMEAFWLEEQRKHGQSEQLEVIRPRIKEYARYYYQVVFREMAKGERKLLQHRFRSLVHGCEAVYREHLKAQREQQKAE